MEKREGFANKKKSYTKKDDKFGKQRRTEKSTKKPYKKNIGSNSESSDSEHKKEYVKKDYTKKDNVKKEFVKKDYTKKPYKKADDKSDSEHKPERKFGEKSFKEYRKNTDRNKTSDKRFERKTGSKPPYKKDYENNDNEQNKDTRFDSKERKPYKKNEDKNVTERNSDKKFVRKDGTKPPYKKFGEKNESERNSDKKFVRKDGTKPPYKKFGEKNESERNSDKKYPSKFNKTFKKPVKENKSTDGSEGVRLNKFIANAGICSRREADVFISTGVVSVNGVIVTVLGTKVMPGDIVKYNDELIRGERKVYVLLNKPKDFVTTLKDPHAKRTVMELVANACKERIYPVGRLDRNTTGVLLLTNDGDMTTKLTHPKNRVSKIYHVMLDKPLTKGDMVKISEGIELEDGIAKADKINYTDLEDKCKIGVEIHSGKNRIVRRIFEALEYNVERLDRAMFAGLTKKNLKRGAWRFLTEKELAFLKMLSTR